jgi:hypothetical protein
MTDIINCTIKLSTMKSRVYYLIGESGCTSTLFPASRVIDAINLGLMRMQNLDYNVYTIMQRNTCACVSEYSLPEARLVQGNAMVENVWLDDTELSYSTFANWIDATGADEPDEIEEPTSYYINGTNLGLYPKPDACYELKVKYHRDYHRLVNDNDTTNLSDMAVEAAVFYAAFELKIKDEQWDAANAFKAMSDQLMQEVMTIPITPAGTYDSYGNVYGSYGGVE